MFISIDQNEFDHLSLLGKHVLRENEIGTLVWKNARDNNPTALRPSMNTYFATHAIKVQSASGRTILPTPRSCCWRSTIA